MLNREQLTTIIDAMFRGATDQIQSSLPPVIPMKEYHDRYFELTQYIAGVTNTLGSQVSVLYDSLTGEGMGSGDYLAHIRFTTWVDLYFLRASETAPSGTFPDTTELVNDVVNDVFGNYLAMNELVVNA